MDSEVERLRSEAFSKTLVMRSCWECNPAHEYLKQSEDLILCFVCGHYYYKGVDITEKREA